MAALHGYLARSPARILLVQIDDLMQELEQINLPGTVNERPNWRRLLSMRVDELRQSPVMQELEHALAQRSRTEQPRSCRGGAPPHVQKWRCESSRSTPYTGMMIQSGRFAAS